MLRKFLSVLVLCLLVTGIVCAENTVTKNIVTVDVGPVFTGLFFGDIASFFDDNAKKAKDDSSGFGIAAQYERQISDRFSLAGRFAYLGAKTYVRFADMDLSSFSIEGHGRYYPFNNGLFLDGMLGYARFMADLSGRDPHTGLNMNLANNYLKLGAKLGWRMDFGKPGGLILETALGYSYGIRIGSDDLDKIDEYSYVFVPMPPPGEWKFASSVERNAVQAMVNQLFISGVRMTIGAGWRF